MEIAHLRRQFFHSLLDALRGVELQSANVHVATATLAPLARRRRQRLLGVPKRPHLRVLGEELLQRYTTQNVDSKP